MDYGYNPYMQQPYYRPQMQPMQQYAALHGRTVTNPAEIQAGDVSNTGVISWFPMADGSCVYAKRWMPDGTIATMRFVAEQEKAPEPTQMDRIEARLKELLEKLENSDDEHGEVRP